MTSRRAAVVGSPIEHSLSPVLHRAAYAALGLDGWTYDRVECDDTRLPALLASLGPEWAGLSVTMPGKRVALAVADETTERADVVGAANTLVRLPGGGWRADCTDVDGVVGALRAAGGYRRGAGGSAVVLGAGGTALAALAGLVELGVTEARLVVREPARAGDAARCAERLGLHLETLRWAEVDLGALAAGADVAISTVPAGVADAEAERLAEAPCVLDVVYHPWPTPLASAVAARGGRLATGLDMLLHQAFGQVEQFTGRSAPKAAMRDALRSATGDVLPLPLD
ncbi:shikimate dehydrogenase [Streptoalloteichus tenebrarius]|uniref:Shikimate dehydrogenase n=1 Tax=Streptoalloteichus tenebrarius (strain ATCC 17920 / DSM 40477 / JCM 4838 / CBS 697.72 / NBRC 16177 / NCIMB 11028 / NRRL B-12390 / A12253. 1 / ISP 5477) TaxID=1933 RepID=A0ABT1HSC3_STRSD|nr:shikimate dehydrogenase [Streptoalloteichus tenebrarius]MCP2258422.1 shikimate dehydrogenase [Streptoalloteichus tenebrarius]